MLYGNGAGVCSNRNREIKDGVPSGLRIQGNGDGTASLAGVYLVRERRPDGNRASGSEVLAVGCHPAVVEAGALEGKVPAKGGLGRRKDNLTDAIRHSEHGELEQGSELLEAYGFLLLDNVSRHRVETAGLRLGDGICRRKGDDIGGLCHGGGIEGPREGIIRPGLTHEAEIAVALN